MSRGVADVQGLILGHLDILLPQEPSKPWPRTFPQADKNEVPSPLDWVHRDAHSRGAGVVGSTAKAWHKVLENHVFLRNLLGKRLMAPRQKPCIWKA